VTVIIFLNQKMSFCYQRSLICYQRSFCYQRSLICYQRSYFYLDCCMNCRLSCFYSDYYRNYGLNYCSNYCCLDDYRNCGLNYCCLDGCKNCFPRSLALNMSCSGLNSKENYLIRCALSYYCEQGLYFYCNWMWNLSLALCNLAYMTCSVLNRLSFCLLLNLAQVWWS